ncbi:pentapeptide repeat-containing protein [Micromonospora chalcea]
MDVRLGAIYSLERIMRDSAVDHPAVVEVLAAFVRVHAPASDAGPIRPVTAAGTFVRPRIPEDVQAALAVLVRRDRRHDQSPKGLNLAATNLGGARLGQATLDGTYLDSADLRGASLEGANLRTAFMGGANLYAAVLFFADLSDTFLGSADLRFANLQGANLQGADLRGANLQNSSLVRADLRGADLRGTAGLTPTILRCTDMDDRTRLPAEVPRPAPLNDPEAKGCRFS